jgi:hypothetical protein
MVNEKLAAIVSQLATKTETGQIVWAPTEKDKVFQAAFARTTVRLSWEPPAKIRVSIYNEEGTLIDTATDEELNGATLITPYTTMKELFEQARRQAMGVDAALDGLLEELGGT